MVYALDMDYAKLTAKKVLLDSHRPLDKNLVRNLDAWFRVELTYTSNAIEGNTLSRRETALVVEKGITVGGKSLDEHLEAQNHAKALDWIQTQTSRSLESIASADILKIHGLILKGIDDENAARYRNIPVRISGSTVIMPNPRKVPALMEDFLLRFTQAKNLHPVELAAQAHYQLVTIHPFVDGNGHTARLLMNMILLMAGYPTAIIRIQDRLAYINALETAQLGGAKDAYFKIIWKAVDRSLDILLKSIKGESEEPTKTRILLKIGELARKAGEANSTIRHWTKEGLLQVEQVTPSGYQLYSDEMLKRIEKIHTLKKKRLNLQEIKETLGI